MLCFHRHLLVFYLLDSSVYIDTQHFSNKDYKNEFENVSGRLELELVSICTGTNWEILSG